jgi:hypothetical protein
MDGVPALKKKLTRDGDGAVHHDGCGGGGWACAAVWRRRRGARVRTRKRSDETSTLVARERAVVYLFERACVWCCV